jgi:VIT1/CCC1 family predicted Fe2+/Mn2+ transporter
LITSAERLLEGEVISFEDVDAIRMAIGDELMESGIDFDTGSVDQRGVELDAHIDWVASLDRSARGEPG